SDCLALASEDAALEAEEAAADSEAAALASDCVAACRAETARSASCLTSSRTKAAPLLIASSTFASARSAARSDRTCARIAASSEAEALAAASCTAETIGGAYSNCDSIKDRNVTVPLPSGTVTSIGPCDSTPRHCKSTRISPGSTSGTEALPFVRNTSTGAVEITRPAWLEEPAAAGFHKTTLSPGRASPPRSVTSIDILTINPPHYSTHPSSITAPRIVRCDAPPPLALAWNSTVAPAGIWSSIIKDLETTPLPISGRNGPSPLRYSDLKTEPLTTMRIP